MQIVQVALIERHRAVIIAQRHLIVSALVVHAPSPKIVFGVICLQVDRLVEIFHGCIKSIQVEESVTPPIEEFWFMAMTFDGVIEFGEGVLVIGRLAVCASPPIVIVCIARIMLNSTIQIVDCQAILLLEIVNAPAEIVIRIILGIELDCLIQHRFRL